MRDAIERANGSAAWLATGYGPCPAYGPDDDRGSDGGEGGASGGDGAVSGSGDGDAKDDATDAGAGDGSGARLRSGLLNRVKAGKGDGDAKDAAKEGEADAKPDGPNDGRPDGLADKFWDADKKAVRADALAKSYAELEAAHGKLKRAKGVGDDVPKSADEYFADGIELPDEVDRLRIEGADDPGLRAAANVFHKYGIGRETGINIVRDMMVEMNKSADAPIDPDAEFAALGEHGEATVEGVALWLDSAADRGVMSERDVEIAESLAETADGIRFLAAVRNMTGERPIPLMPGSGPRGMSREQWGDAYKKAVREGDYKEQERLDGMSAAIFGDDPSHGANAVAVDANRTRRTSG